MQIVGHRSILESYYKLGETLNPDLKIREYDRVRSSPDVYNSHRRLCYVWPLNQVQGYFSYFEAVEPNIK